MKLKCWLIAITISLIALFFSWPVQAAQHIEYKVKKGDCLTAIAKIYKVPYKSVRASNSGIKNPDKIYPNQIINIPLSSKRGLGKKVAKPFYWDKMGGKPFGKRDYKKGIMMYNDKFTLEAKEAVINMIVTGQGVKHIIKPGDHFEQMQSGNFDVIDDVIARFAKDKVKEKEAIKYCALIDGIMYCVADPECHNWPWWMEEVPPPPEEEEPEEPVTPQPPVPVVPIVPEAPVTPEEPVPGQPEAFCLNCNHYIESWVYTGLIMGLQKENHSDHTWYYGVNIFYAPCEVYIWNGKLRIGPAAEFTGWQGGIDHDNILYKGYMLAYGLEIQHERAMAKDMVRIMYGEKYGEVWATFPYSSTESAQILVFDAGHQWWYGRTWFNEFEFRFHVEADLFTGNREKDSFLNGNKIEEKPLNQGVYTFSVKTEYFKSGPWALTAENTLGYTESNHGLFDQFSLGAKYNDMVEGGALIKWNEYSGNEQWGLYLIVNLSNTVENGWKWITAQGSNSDQANKDAEQNSTDDTKNEEKTVKPETEKEAGALANDKTEEPVVTESDEETETEAKEVKPAEKISLNNFGKSYVTTVLKDDRDNNTNAKSVSYTTTHLVDDRTDNLASKMADNNDEKLVKLYLTRNEKMGNTNFAEIQ